MLSVADYLRTQSALEGIYVTFHFSIKVTLNISPARAVAELILVK